jgi:NitT/TauT family transport system ATP-binding protein
MNNVLEFAADPRGDAAGAVAISDVSMVFADRRGDRRRVLDDVSLDVAPHEFVCIVGPSGCGKTTLIKIVQGLTVPTAGRVTVGGVDVASAPPDAGFVFQQDSLLPWRTVFDNIAFPLELKKWRKQRIRDRVEYLTSLVGLEGFDASYPHELSGGMRQRVNLARALASSPQVLIMDEPFAALDALTRAQMQTELLRIWSEEKKTVLFVTHQIDEAVLLADRVVTMAARPGRIAEILPVSLPRPRSAATRHDPEFKEKVDYLWERLHSE